METPHPMAYEVSGIVFFIFCETKNLDIDYYLYFFKKRFIFQKRHMKRN